MTLGKRRVAVLPGDGTIVLEEHDVPGLRAGQVLIDVRASLVSPGTELGGWDNLAAKLHGGARAGNRKTFGYSAAGVVVDTGPGVNRFSAGDRVAAIGAGYALHSTVDVVPQNLCIAIPDGISFEDASYSMLLATALHAVRRGAPVIGEYWVVYGLGIVGLLTARLLQLSGCFVAGVDGHEFRVSLGADWLDSLSLLRTDSDRAKRLRDFTGGSGMDGSVFAFGGDATETMDEAVDLMKLSPDGHPEGTIVTVGWPTFPYTGRIGAMNNIDLRRASRTGPGYHDEQWEHGSDYPPVFVRWTTSRNLDVCLRLVAAGKIDVSRLTTHRVALRDVESAVPRMLDKPDAILGVIFTSEQEAP